MATTLTFILTLTVVSSYVPASAVVAACDGSSTQNTMKVTALHGQVVYIDTGTMPRLDAAYVSYRVTNTSATAREHIYIELSNFTGNVVRLANPLDSNTIVDNLAGNSSQTTYFLLQASTPTTTDQVHTVKIYNKRPDLGGTVLYTCNYTFTDVKDTIKAKSNKVVSVSTSNTSPVLGELLTFTVEGKTGVVGQGESPDGDIMWFSPSAYASWPTRALRLESISVLLDSDGNFSTTSDQGTYTDQLILKGVQSLTLGGPSNKIGSNSRYRAQYNFRVIGSAPNGTKVVPVAQISSGRKIKHTDTATTDTGAFPQLTFDKVDSTININKSAVVVDPQQPAGFSTIKYTLDITTNSVEELLVDEIVDDPDAGIDIVEGSVKFSDNRNTTLTSMLDPSTDASNNSHFIGPFYLRASNAARIEYLAYIPRPTEPTSYRNYAYGYIGDRLIGKSNTFVDGIRITSGPDGPVINDDQRTIGPTIATAAASGIATTVSTLNALIDPNENFTAFGFQYSTSATLATTTCVQTAGSASQSNSIDELSYSYSLSGLTANTTYYFRAVANSDSLVAVTDACTTPDLVGEIYSFTTTPQGLLSQSITWTTVFSNLTTSTPLTLTTAATASSTLPVTLTPTNPDVCIVSEQPDPDNATAGYAVITIVGPGTCELTATQDGNASYAAATPVVKSFTVSGVNLGLTIVGSGTVTSDVGNVNCSSSCTKSIRTNTTIVLTATPASGFVFSSWSGACSGGGTCSVTMDSAKSVTATFAAAPYTVDLTVNGSGEVSNSLNADKCTSTCVIGAVFGNSITLTPTPAQGWSFTSWSGACSGTGNCVLSIDGNKTVTATFTKRNARVDVTTRGNGRVVNDYGNPSCRGNCSIDAYEYDSVTLTANPDAGWEFTGWTGACSGTSPTCVISLIPPSSSPSIAGTSSYKISSSSLNQLIKSTEATFQISQQNLNVNVSGNGAVTDSGSFNCTSTCSKTYDYNTVVVLSTQPASGWQFAGWSGACSGTGACSVTMDAAKSVSALFTQITHTLSVTIIGSGGVAGTSALSCTSNCSKVYNEGDVVTLSASPDVSNYFAGWTGDCVGLNDCTITITRDMNVTAEFTLVPVVTHDLTMTIVGNGSISGDLSCNTASCIETLAENTNLNLIAYADPGWQFTGWSEDCTGSLDCSLSMNADKSVTATFTQITHDLNVTIVGSGSVIDGGTMNCATSCTQTYFEGDVITLTATPISGWQFTGWSEDCSGTGACELTISSNKNVTATFTQIEHDLTISIIGNGTVGGDYSCISGPCSHSIIEGSKVSLTATADPGWQFTGWSEDCTGSLDCSLTMTGNMSVTATFVRITHPLDIYITGSGTVTDSGSITCSAASCTETLNDGDVVTLIAIPDSGWEFTGWSGDCSGTSDCILTITSDKAVTATFVRITYTLDITINGNGSVSDGGGITCTTTCSETLNSGDVITLTATPDTGWKFTGWSGACTGTGTCTITMNSAKAVTATFALITYELDINIIGDGTVTDSGSISCTNDCIETLDENQEITLTATPDPGWEFTGWTGACTGTGTCTIAMNSDKEVTATFTLITQPLSITISGDGDVSDGALISCINSCLEDVAENAVITLTATPDPGWYFAGWSGDCSGMDTCSLTMNSAKYVTAEFLLIPIITHDLTINVLGSGKASDGGSIDCRSSCTSSQVDGTSITLTATPDAGWEFTGWSGACSGTGDCTITITADTTVTANFSEIQTVTLTITVIGSGTVLGESIACRDECVYEVERDSIIDLMALADIDWSFEGWGGVCSGVEKCDLSMSTSRSVTATFRPVLIMNPNTLTIKIVGIGEVKVNDDSVCVDECTYFFMPGTDVSLTSSADDDWQFSHWSDICQSANCTVSMSEDMELTVYFAPPPPPAQYSPSLKKTIVRWDAIQAPDEKEIIYTLSSNGKVLCKTTDLNCSVKGILGPKSSLRITSEMLGMKSDEGSVALKKGKLLITVRFDFDKFNVKDRYKQKLKRIAKAFAKAGFTKYEIRGHTDNRGDNSYNKLLSRFRAFSVIRDMRKFARLTYKTTWYGERKPIASNKYPKGRKENRRTEIRIVL